MIHEDICICGHYDNRHDDIDDGSVFGKWGAVKCELCRCSRFECAKCVKGKITSNNNFINYVYNVKDKLPKDDQEVLAQDANGDLYLATYDNEAKVWDGGCCYYDMDIVCWATLPEKLKE